jgi:hypothetical protein
MQVANRRAVIVALSATVLLIVGLHTTLVAGGAPRSRSDTTDVEAFIAAHYDEYVIDTFAVEPTVEALITLVEKDPSELAALGVDVRLQFMSDIRTKLPIQLIDQVQTLSSVDSMVFVTWESNLARTLEQFAGLYAIDTVDTEHWVSVWVETTGDFSQLDSVAISWDSLGGNMAAAKVPWKKLRDINMLESIVSAVPDQRTVGYDNAFSEGGSPRSFEPQSGCIVGNIRLPNLEPARSLSARLMELKYRHANRSTGKIPEVEAAICKIDRSGRFGFIGIPIGRYAVELILTPYRPGTDGVHGQPQVALRIPDIPVEPDSCAVLILDLETEVPDSHIPIIQDWERRYIPR